MICLINLLLLSADGNSASWTRVTEQNFEMSSCLFSNGSRLHYSCYDQQGHNENSAIIKLNTYKVTEHLCEQSQRNCKNISLLFFKSRKVGLCISSTTKTLKQIYVRLLHFPVYYQYFSVCVKSQFQLQRKNYTGIFNCTTDVDKMRELVFTISGYDVTIDRVWNTILKINIVDK